LAFDVGVLTLLCKANSWKAGYMSFGSWFFVSIGLPAIIVLVGYVAMRLHEWDLNRSHTKPGE
jgi:hypothetical protein